MSLESIIKKKDGYTDGLLALFNKQWDTITPDLQKGLVNLFKTNDYSAASIQAVFKANGFDDLAVDVASAYNKMFDFSKQVSKELGYDFIITAENSTLFSQMSELNLETLLNTKSQIALDMKRFAIESQIQGSTVNSIRSGLDEQFLKMGRRLNTEIFTGIRNFESSVDLVSMQNGGIEKFLYLGPFDNATRDECSSTLSDPKQQTGWTAAEVESSQTPFIERGGFNCRHRWVAFV